MIQPPPTQRLDGLRILVVEDNFLIANYLKRMLQNLGCEIVGPTLSLEIGEKMAAEQKLDGAVLDIDLNGSSSFPIANILHKRQTPFIFITGYASPQFNANPELAKYRRLYKPLDEQGFIQAICDDFKSAPPPQATASA